MFTPSKTEGKSWLMLLSLPAIVAYAAWKSFDTPSEWVASGWLPDYGFGFLRRGLPGQLLFGDSVNLEGVRLYGAIVIALLAATLAIGMIAFYRRATAIGNRTGPLVYRWLLLAAVAPFTIVQIASDSGRFDHISILLTVGALCAATKRSLAWLAVVAIPIIVVSNDVAIFVELPALFCVWFVLVPRSRHRDRTLGAGLGAAVAGIVIVLAAGRPDVPLAQLHDYASQRADGFRVPAGFLEAYYHTVGERISHTVGRWNARSLRHLATILALLLPLLVLTTLGWRAILRDEPRFARLLPGTALTGLPLFMLGFDFFRWLGLILLAQWALLFTFAHVRKRHAELGAVVAQHPWWTMLAFTSSLFVGPIGIMTILPARCVLLRF